MKFFLWRYKHLLLSIPKQGSNKPRVGWPDAAGAHNCSVKKAAVTVLGRQHSDAVLVNEQKQQWEGVHSSCAKRSSGWCARTIIAVGLWSVSWLSENGPRQLIFEFLATGQCSSLIRLEGLWGIALLKEVCS